MFLLFSFQYGDAAIHTAVRHDHVHLLPYLLGQSFQSVLLPTRNGSHKEVEHVNLQNEVSAKTRNFPKPYSNPKIGVFRVDNPDLNMSQTRPNPNPNFRDFGFRVRLLPTRNGSHKEVEHVNLQNEVSAIKAPLSIYFESTNLLFIPFT